MSDRNDGMSAMSSVKLALLAQQVRQQLDGGGVLAAEPIAIICMGCRFPGGADSPDAFWSLLERRVDAVREVPPERWDVNAFYDSDPSTPGKMNWRRGGFLDQVDQFDAAFFGIAPREAARMDPQQRLLLEVAFEALDRAGQSREQLAGSLTGVFIAATLLDYADRQYGSLADIDAHTVTGNMHCIIPNRLSYLLDLRGPSIAIDTACSSSLVAIHTACQSLRNRDSDMALAGGVNVILSPEPGVALTKWGVISPTGRCRTFDAAADGFVRAEGCGVIVLKRLSDALADGDPVLAVVRGSAINQDGRSTAMSAPNGLAQQDVVRRALSNGQVLAEQIGYIEAHGTGTALGDPIEVEALAAVIGPRFPGAPPVALTSVKTNTGHLEAAAGVAGVIKAVLCMQHEAIPPHLHFTSLNPHISLDHTRLFIPVDGHPWPAGPVRRLAGVSSFGFGGTNAHVIVEEPPRLPAPAVTAGPFLLALSAQQPTALAESAERFADRISGADDAELGAICFTAGARRTHLDERVAVVGADRGELVERLRLFAHGARRPGIAAGRREPGTPRRLAFVFSGQGPQWWGMGRELLATEPTFRDVVERCDELLRRQVGWSLLEELGRSESDTRLGDTEIAQPALFALQVGVATLWRERGFTPYAVIGHSVGEVAAAHIAGSLSLEDAVQLIAHRGRLMQAATGNGKMASVELAHDAVERAIAGYGDRVAVAAINAPQATVISGQAAAVDEVVAALQREGANVRSLPVNYAFHSAQMSSYASSLERALDGLPTMPRPSPPPAYGNVRFVSTVTGAIHPTDRLDAAYWARNVREPVRFTSAVEAAASAGCNVFLEIGPHPVLGAMIAQTLAASGSAGEVTCSLRRGRPERESLLAAAGDLYSWGVAVDWTRLLPGRNRVVDLPTYPWQRSRHWFEVPRHTTAPPRRGIDIGAHPLLGDRVRSAAIRGAVFERRLTTADPAFLDDHRIGGGAILAATTFLELGAAAYEATTGTRARSMRDVELLAALALDADVEQVVQVHLEDDLDGATFRVSSLRADDSWTLHAAGHISSVEGP
ncbi:MAG: hypothetical protein JWM12_445, partial [Ilumatobacteraceae bacterium]|nr:hypothetical protein [Ilumatobacteraceae bacterium]